MLWSTQPAPLLVLARFRAKNQLTKNKSHGVTPFWHNDTRSRVTVTFGARRPLGNLGGAKALALLDAIHRSLAGGGMYIQFQHSLLDRKKIRTRFSNLCTAPVFLNFPPAVVYYARR